MNPGRSVGVLLALLAPAALAQPVVIDAKEAFQLKLLDGGPLPFVGLYSFFPVPGEGRAFAEQQLYTTQRTDYWIAGVAVGGAGAGSILETVPSPIAGKDFFPDRVELVLPNLGNYWIMGRNGVTVRNTDAGLEQTIVPDGGVNADQSRAALTPTGEFRLFNFGQGFLGPGIFSNSLHSIAGTQTYWPSQASLMVFPDTDPALDVISDFFPVSTTNDIYAVSTTSDGGPAMVFHGTFIEGSILGVERFQPIGPLPARDVVVDFYRSTSSPYLLAFSGHGIEV